jgi:hypothetical protein
MKIYAGNLFDCDGDALCITTNNQVNGRGEAVMGRGVALEAKKRWPWLPLILGRDRRYSRAVCFNITAVSLQPAEYALISFPTKTDWRFPSNLSLIATSANKLRRIADEFLLVNIWLSPPGCGNGGLKWPVVEKVLAKYLDDRFTIAFNVL